MVVSYKKLWKLLIDKDLMKKDLQSNAGVSWATITKMSKGETVSTDVLMKICKYLQCDVGDIVEFINVDVKDENAGKQFYYLGAMSVLWDYNFDTMIIAPNCMNAEQKGVPEDE